MNKFYLTTTTWIVTLSQFAIWLTLLNFVYTYSERHAIIMFVCWLVMELSAKNLRLFVEGMKNENSKKP